ncbi:MFS transporter, putative [Paecilomyces variotii No. 5]|uniref:MFS transporter, putative n=1 Tax=Byssochlamys spectabilis (strain No. 5 / NBRC 109023) TaxID=1356009 RepID=V5GCL3_BYSSN|nr:MFS transporter, putative [Paecilomyces variotii No. 5]
MQDRRTAVLVVSIILFAIATAIVALRFISRIAIVKKILFHDYLILLAWVLDLGLSVSLFIATSQGLGLHEKDVNPANQPALNRAEYTFTVLYNPVLMAIKTSILVFYLTLTRTEKFFRWANYVTLAVVNVAGFALTFVNLFQCRPVSAAFTYPVPAHATCTDIVTLYLSSAPVNIITDLMILVLPIPILTRMRLPQKQKIILVLTFSFGFFVAVVDVIRIVYLQSASTSRYLSYKAYDTSYNDSVEYSDFTWYASLAFMWTAIEVNAGMMCACVPSLKPLVSRLFPRMLRDTDEVTCDGSVEPPTASVDMAATASSPADLRPMAPALRNSGSGATGSGSGSRTGTRWSGDDTIRNSSAGQSTFMEFLLSSQRRQNDEEADAAGTNSTVRRHIHFFDFVNMNQPKSMLKMTNKESIPPIALTTILFFLWGFAYGLLDILNTQFLQIVHLDSWSSLGMHGAYYGGYVLGPFLVGYPVLTKWGFKPTFMTGLFIYACGSLIFWPAAVLTSFSAYIVSNLVVGCGISVLETAANPFIALCGPQENSEIRLNISQGVQAIGSVVSPLLAKKVLFKQVNDAPSLVDVQWTYLAIALFDMLLAVVFYYMPIPEASDEDLKELASRRHADNSAKVGPIPVVWLTFSLGVFSMFCYVGGQEAVSTNFEALMNHLKPNSSGISSFEYLTIAHTVFAIGRFLTAFAQWFLKPRWILLVAYIGMIVFSVLCMNVSGYPGIAMALMVYVFESGAFSIIFAISLRGTAQYTKLAAVIMTAAISGGSVFPFPQFAAYRARGIQYSFCVAVAVFAAGAIFPLYLNLVPAARKQVDPVPNEYLRRHHPLRHLHKQDVAEKDSPRGSSRRGSGNSNPSPDLQRPAASHRRNYTDMTGSTNTGGIMHELAPWPNT